MTRTASGWNFMFARKANKHSLFKKARGLDLPLGKYALFGSAPMCVRGLRECRDLDIIAFPDVWEEWGKKPEWRRGTTASGSPNLKMGMMELLKDWKPGDWDIRALIAEADVIDGLPFVRLERVIEWKRIYGREKDIRDIEAVEKFLAKDR